MSNQIREADWKVLRELMPIALERSASASSPRFAVSLRGPARAPTALPGGIQADKMQG